MAGQKKRKLDITTFSDAQIDEYLPEIAGEINLEIGLRQRLAETLESRITWALILQESLVKGSIGSTSSFKDAALDALSAVEAPSDLIFSREVLPPFRVHPPQTKPSRPPPRQKQVVTRNSNSKFLYIRTASLDDPAYVEGNSPVQTYLLRCPNCQRKTFTSLQGLLNHARISHGHEWGTHDECVRACAVIESDIDVGAGIEVILGPGGILPGLRSIFQMAVGADRHNEYNPEYSARPNTDNGGTNGSHLTRTLGLHKDTPALAPFLGKDAIRRGIKVWDQADTIIDIDGSDDTTIFAQSADVNMDADSSFSVSTSKHRRVWRMAFAHRNSFGSLPEIQSQDVPLDSKVTETEAGEAMHTTIPSISNVDTLPISPISPPSVLSATAGFVASLPTSGSRFHIIARVVVADRSFWIPPERRENPHNEHTHKWMISVDAPSYAHHITSILKRITVTSLSHPSLASFSPLSATDPPFVVVGTTDEPFLARVELIFTGSQNAKSEPGKTDSEGQKVVLEHWVELDLLRSANAMIGEEQVVDIELDKGTIIMPAKTGYTPIGAKMLWEIGSSGTEKIESRNFSKGKIASGAENIDGYAKVLTGLLTRFPMTLKDIKGGRPPRPPLPYKLVSSPAQFINLVTGRRKAIEWGRAHAMQEAYTQAVASMHMQDNAVALSTADVFVWLSDGGHFPRPVPLPSLPTTDIIKEGFNDEKHKKKPEHRKENWCRICGLGDKAHLAVHGIKTEDNDSGTSVNSESVDEIVPLERRQPQYVCAIAPKGLEIARIPLVDINDMLIDYSRLQTTHTGNKPHKSSLHPTKRLRGADLVAVSDPYITLAIRNMVHGLNLPSFERTSMENQPEAPPLRYPLDDLGTQRTQVEEHLAPHALLALLTKCLVQKLVEGGLEVAKRDKATAAGLAVYAQKKGVKKAGKDEILSVLTPIHVLNGIVARGRSDKRDAADLAIFLTLSRLGTQVDMRVPNTYVLQKEKMELAKAHSSAEKVAHVKMEQD